jgi:hypothetical protein
MCSSMPFRSFAAPSSAALLLVALAAPPAFAQGARGGVSDTIGGHPSARIEIPFVDLPYSARFGGRAPSMQQSIDVTAGVYDAGHLAIQHAWGTHTRLAKVTIATVDYFAISAPLADAWLHEEGHRAVLGYRGIGSRNDVYSLNLLATSISVSHARDEDLARLKREHPAEFVRLKAAGMESEYEMVTRLEREQFFRGGRAWHTALYWLTTIGSVAYLADSSGTDEMTDDFNRDERTVAVRDISGHDYTAWVRDLFRPDEPFEARGVHPSGVGVNRYTKNTDLTPDEQRYLYHEGRLAFLNFLDPNLLGIRGFAVRSPVGGGRMRANLAMRHQLTSFGHTVDAHVFLNQGQTNLFVVLHAYANRARTLPGLDVEMVDHPLTLGGRRLELSPRLAIWAQPAGQAFRTTEARLGGMAALRVRVPLTKRLGALAEVEAKTAGWVAGVVQLDRAVNVRFGGSTTLW